ncbi:MAG: hypothetical protein JSW25_03845, partial [Thermoplasmata archaeon]
VEDVPVEGDTVEVHVRVQDFAGNDVILDAGFRLHVFLGHEPVMSDLVLEPGEGVYTTSFEADRAGEYEVFLTHEGMHLSSSGFQVSAAPEAEPVLTTSLALALVAIIIVAVVAVLFVATRA